MQFTQAEIRFLLGGPNVEYGNGELLHAHYEDMRDRGCPERIFNRVIEDRARQAGRKFAEFRSKNGICNPQEFVSTTTTSAPAPMQKLF